MEFSDLPQPKQQSPSQPFWLNPKPIWKAPPRKINDWEQIARIAQTQALALIQKLFETDYNIPVLEYPWSDAHYPSIVKIWGIDSLDEDPAFPLDQVWLQRSHPDKPQEWVVLATTTDDSPLTYRDLPDGTRLEEGTRAYLDDVLLEMMSSHEKAERDLGKTLKNALSTGQLRYRHLHSAYDRNTLTWEIEALYEFPIYPAIYSEISQQFCE